MSRDAIREAWCRVGYGVDFQGPRRVVVRAERGRKGVTLTPVTFAQDALGTGAVAVAMEPRESITQWLEVAFGSRSKALKVLPTVLDIQLPFAIEQCAYEFPILRRTAEGRTRALGVAARFVDLERTLARCAAAGLDPAVCDHEGLALWTQSITEMPGEAAGEGAVRVVAYRGTDRATLVIGAAGEYRSAHAVRLDDAAQVRRLVRAAGGEGVRSIAWWWAGPGAEDKSACASLLDTIGQEWACTVAYHRDPANFLARALATRLVTDGARRCNLRMGRLEHPAVRQARARGMRRAIAVALAGGVVLCGMNLAVSASVRGRGVAFDAAFRTAAVAAAGPVFGAAKGEQAVLIARREVAAQGLAAAPYQQYMDPIVSRVVHTVMEQAALENLIIEVLTVKPEKVVVHGRGRAWESAAPLAKALEAQGYGSTIQREDPLPDATVPFSVTAEARHE
ncbi:MAG: hypothetical protein O3B24_03365 [Verrucomicrobia bacterium]|nr:hypothetical protein [Verrucomicrobiota bacterium]